MTLVSKSLEEMFEEVKVNRLLFFDYWKPSEHPERHKEVVHGHLGRYVIIRKDYVFEILDFIQEDLDISSDRLLEGALILGIENSLTRGHHCDLNYPISIKVFGGSERCVIRIRDSGSGFNFKDYIRKFRSRDASYVQGNGMGFITLDAPVFDVSYDNGGSALNILVKNGYCQERSYRLVMSQ